jgi:Nucleotidyltransferase of unknown function (DUF6036)
MVSYPTEGFDPPLAALGQLLAERGLRYELLAIGGGALQLLGLITRPTRDIDVVALVEQAELVPFEALPDPLQRAVADTAAVFRISDEWFNAGPRSLTEHGLPDGVLVRAHRREWGGLVLHLADRQDQVFFKLYAAVDQGPKSKHFEDLRRLTPTVDELRAAAAWAQTHDPSEGFRRELRFALRDLGVGDGDV